MKIFKLEINQNQKLDEFKNKQESNIMYKRDQLVNKWTDTLCKIIKKNIQKVGKGTFNLEEKVRDTYEQSKLKKILNVIKYKMQNILNELTIQNVNE